MAEWEDLNASFSEICTQPHDEAEVHENPTTPTTPTTPPAAETFTEPLELVLNDPQRIYLVTYSKLKIKKILMI